MSYYYEIHPSGDIADSLPEAKKKAAEHTGRTGEDTYINLVASVPVLRCRKTGEFHDNVTYEDLPLPH